MPDEETLVSRCICSIPLLQNVSAKSRPPVVAPTTIGGIILKRISAFFAVSAGELKNLRSLTLASVLTAIYAVSYSPIAGNIVIVPGLIELRFGFLAIAVAAMLLGPVMGMLVALLGDVLGTILFYGGSFFWGYTISWVLMGFVFGCFLYKYKISSLRIIGATVFHTVFINQFLVTYWQSFLGFGAFDALFTTRLIRNAIMLPVNIVLLFVVLKGVLSVYRRANRIVC